MKSLEKILKKVAFWAVFSIPFIVFLVDSSQVFPFITGKNFAFRLLVEVAFFAWIALAFFREEYRPKKSWLLGSVVLFVGVMFVANMFGMEPKQSFWSNFERMDGWVTLVHLLVYTIVLSSLLHTKDLWRKFWNTTVIASVGVGLFAMAQLLREYLTETLGRSGEEGLARLLPIVNQGGERLDATFGNATYLAVYMLFHIFITTMLLLRYKSLGTKWKVFYGCALLLQLVSLFYTATRGAILGLVGGVLITAILFFIFEQKGTQVKRVATGILVLTLFVVGLFFAMKDTEFVRGQNTLNRLANISLEDKTTKSRFLMWDLSWEGVKERPILGYGQGNFNYVFNTHYNPELYDQEQWFDRAHNVVFDWLIAGGVVGFASYVLIYVALLLMLIKNNQLSRREKIVFIGMLSAYVFQNMFVFDQIGSYIIFFAFVAYVHSLGAKQDLYPKMFEVREGKRDRFVIPVLIVALFVTPYMLNASGYFQSQATISALQMPQARSVEELNTNVQRVLDLLNQALEYEAMGTAEIRERLPGVTLQILQAQQVSDLLKQEFFALTKSQLEKQLEETPKDARYHLIYGDFMLSVGQFEEGIEHFEIARDLSPRKQTIYTSLARTHAAAGNTELMLEEARNGYRIYTENDDMWVVYMIALQTNAEEETYKAEIAEAVEKKQYNRLINLARTQIRNNPDLPQLRISLAQLYVQQGDIEKATDVIQEAIEDLPEQFPGSVESIIEELQTQDVE